MSNKRTSFTNGFQDPQAVAEACHNRSRKDVCNNETELQKFIEMESAKNLEKYKRLSTRHTNFAGSYVIKGVKALNKENDMVVRRSAFVSSNL